MPRADQRGEKNPCWRGGRTRTSKGYVAIHSPGHPRAWKGSASYVLEHVLVAEKKLGRFLSKDERVHHVNHVKDDNRPENLLIMTHGEHTRLHWLGRKHSPEAIFKMRGPRGPSLRRNLVECFVCNKKFHRKPYTIKRRKSLHLFCSSSCYGHYRKKAKLR